MTNTYLILGLMALTLALGWLGGWMHRRLARPTMMMDIVDFHERFGLDYDGVARVLPTDLANFRIGFMREELDEYVSAEEQLGDLVRDNGSMRSRSVTDQVDKLLELELDALVDLTYVTLGTAYLQFGHDTFVEAWKRVQLANMAKVRKLKAEEGHTDSGRAAQYDVVKPAGWVAPSHIDLIELRHL